MTSARARQPRDAPERRGIGQQHHVAVALLPARHRVAVDGVHVDVDREQVVARLGAVAQHLLLEEPGRDALADQAALRIGERDDDGVDLAGRDPGVEFGDGGLPLIRVPSRTGDDPTFEPRLARIRA